MPDTARLPPMPVFSPSSATTSGLELLAAAASTAHSGVPKPQQDQLALGLTKPGPYNPAASLPPRIVKKIINLEFVEMSDLAADIWVDDSLSSDTTHPTNRRPNSKPPVTDIKIWLECFSRMAAVLVSRFPEKGPELWAYQTTILRAAHNYEGSNWVAYDRQFRRHMLACKDLNWSIPHPRLYNEAFTGRAKAVPRCPHCLCEDHTGAVCPHNPNPPLLGWYSDPRQLTPQGGSSPMATVPLSQGGNLAPEICRNFNSGRCRFNRCRFLHCCLDCSGPHPSMFCPRRASLQAGPPARARPSGRGRQGQAHPYFSTGPRR